MKINRRVLTLTVAITLLLSGCANSGLNKPDEKNSSNIRDETVHQIIAKTSASNPLVFSHRGTIHDNPEHSFAGYKQAIRDGSGFIEQDVILSKDNQLYVSHDDDLSRTTGNKIKISESDSNTLNKVRLRNGEHLHKLADVFDKYKHKIHYIIEAKSDGTNVETEHALAKVIYNHHMTDNVIVQDSCVHGIESFHAAKGMKNVPLLQLMAGGNEETLIAEIKKLPSYLTFVSVPFTSFTARVNQQIHSEGFLSDVFTIDEYTDNYTVFKDERPDSAFTNETRTTIRFLANHHLSDTQ